MPVERLSISLFPEEIKDFEVVKKHLNRSSDSDCVREMIRIIKESIKETEQ